MNIRCNTCFWTHISAVDSGPKREKLPAASQLNRAFMPTSWVIIAGLLLSYGSPRSTFGAPFVEAPHGLVYNWLKKDKSVGQNS